MQITITSHAHARFKERFPQLWKIGIDICVLVKETLIPTTERPYKSGLKEKCALAFGDDVTFRFHRLYKIAFLMKHDVVVTVMPIKWLKERKVVQDIRLLDMGSMRVARIDGIITDHSIELEDELKNEILPLITDTEPFVKISNLRSVYRIKIVDAEYDFYAVKNRQTRDYMVFMIKDRDIVEKLKREEIV